MAAGGGKHKGSSKQGGRCRTKRRVAPAQEDHSRLEHWSRAQLSRVGLCKVKVPRKGKGPQIGLRAIDGADVRKVASAVLSLPVDERRAVRLGIKPFTALAIGREIGRAAA